MFKVLWRTLDLDPSTESLHNPFIAIPLDRFSYGTPSLRKPQVAILEEEGTLALLYKHLEDLHFLGST